jgi:hypothetical protein
MPRPKTSRLVTVSVKLSPEDLAWLDSASEARGKIGRAEVIRRMIEAQRRRDGSQLQSKPTDRPSVHSIVEASSACAGFRPSKGNALRCLCGRRKADHR